VLDAAAGSHCEESSLSAAAQQAAGKILATFKKKYLILSCLYLARQQP
jgi:hypothetical protein